MMSLRSSALLQDCLGQERTGKCLESHEEPGGLHWAGGSRQRALQGKAQGQLLWHSAVVVLSGYSRVFCMLKDSYMHTNVSVFFRCLI